MQKRTYLSLAMSDDRNLMALTLARKLSEFGETIDDELPLDTEAPYAFQFNGNTNREKSWKQSMLMKGKELNYNSRKTLDYLRDFFGLPEGLPEQLVRDTLGIKPLPTSRKIRIPSPMLSLIRYLCGITPKGNISLISLDISAR